MGPPAITSHLPAIAAYLEVESLDAVPAGLAAVFSDPELGVQLARLPEFLNSETLQVMVKTPYSP